MAKASGAREILLDILIRDFRHEVEGARRDGMSWKEISTAAGLPEYVIMIIAGETKRNRPTRDRQSGT